MFQALRIRDFRLLWAGGMVSSIGSWLLVIAVPAHVFLATGSLRATGLTLAAEYLPALALGPLAGVVTDRLDRRRLMAGTNVFRAGAVAVMLLGIAPGRYWVLYLALLADSAGGTLYGPAQQARTPQIVGTGTLLSSASALNTATSGAVRLIGGPLGGVLLALSGIKWLICADVLSYLVSAAASLMTSRTCSGPAARRATLADVASDLAEGARVLARQPAARALLPVTAAFLAANASLSAVLIPFGMRRLGGGEHIGLLLSCLGMGFLLAAPALRALLDRAQPRYLLAATLTGSAAGYFALFTSTSLGTALPAAVAVGMFGSMSEAVPLTTLQRVIPGTALGRISAAFLTAEAAATLAGATAGPFVAQAAHLAGIAAAASLLTLGAAVLALAAVPHLCLHAVVAEGRAANRARPAGQPQPAEPGWAASVTPDVAGVTAVGHRCAPDGPATGRPGGALDVGDGPGAQA